MSSFEEDDAARSFLEAVEEQQQQTGTLVVEEGGDDDQVLSQLSTISEELMSDMPKLEIVLKNLLSFVVARSQQTDEPVRIEDGLGVVKLVVKFLSNLELPDPAQWGAQEENRQGENQSADSRIDQLVRYKVARLLHERVKRSPGVKMTKTFGIKLLRWTGAWRDISAAVMGSAGDSSPLSLTMLQALEASLRLTSDEAALDDDEAGDLASMRSTAGVDLIFAPSSAHFNVALQARKDRRMEELGVFKV